MSEFKLMVSGEGPTDFGDSYAGELTPGPMLVLTQRMLSDQGVDCPNTAVQLVKEGDLRRMAQQVRLEKRRFFMYGEKWPKGYADFRANAHTLGLCATEEDASVAVLFRDCDKTHTTPRQNWETRIRSIKKGFEYARFSRGVAMVPKPCSEAWLLALHLGELDAGKVEDLPGNLESENHPKNILANKHGLAGREPLLNLVKEKYIQNSIKMPSFQHFEAGLGKAVNEWRNA